jgi:hypothetical protein
MVLLLCLWAYPAAAQQVAVAPDFLTKKIPPRPAHALSGADFARQILAGQGAEREQAIRDQLSRGNLPDFLRRLKPVRLARRFEDGTVSTATVFVMPDYLAIGSDQDFLRIPMNLYTALAVAGEFGFVLPTRRVVDAIFAQSDIHLTPQPLPAGPRMRSTAYYVQHNLEIAQQRSSRGGPASALVSGDKKDVVLAKALVRNKSRVAIYGWHRPSGTPIQPVSTVHGAAYADYSHGIRLVSETVLIDGEPRSVYDVLEDPKLSTLLSDEGTIAGIRQVFLAPQP